MKPQTLITFIVVALIAVMLMNSNTSERTEIENSIPKYHVINALDASGTTKGDNWPWPNKSFFEQQLEFLELNGGGVLEVYNFSSSIPVPVKVVIEPKMTIPNIYEGEASVKAAMETNKIIEKRNKTSKVLFWRQIEANILHYSPKNNDDYSYINKNCIAILKSLNLPQYKNHRKFAFFYTDFINDTPNMKKDDFNVDIIAQISLKTDLSICDYTNYNRDVKAIKLPNYNDFIEVLNSNL